jgi:hypothetical protein
VEALRHVAQGREAIELAIDLRVDLRQALQATGQIRPALERLHEAAAMAEALGDRRRLGRICAFMTYSYCPGTIGPSRRAGVPSPSPRPSETPRSGS